MSALDQLEQFITVVAIAKAHRLIDLYAAAGIGHERVLIKVASTWKGIHADERPCCRHTNEGIGIIQYVARS